MHTVQYDAVICHSVNHCWSNKGRMFLGYYIGSNTSKEKVILYIHIFGQGGSSNEIIRLFDWMSSPGNANLISY